RQRRVRLPLSPTQWRIASALARRQPVEHPTAADAWAGVALLIAPDPDAVLLIRRAERVGDPWSGHIGLPGGRREPADSDLIATAIRETEEEVGCLLDTSQLLGTLDDVWPRTPLPRVVVVRPAVFALPDRPALRLSAEVADAFWVPLTDLQDPSRYRDTIVSLYGQDRAFPAYYLSDYIVWGLTERVLTPVLGMLGGEE
ncbi:MAG: CoA pyrophosphatase, partial [Gemmatimonadota bacterium]|nr:CoA pyrophosphatase [Gemmatimonadota bacterium]